MMTFTREKPLVENPGFEEQREATRRQLREMIRVRDIDPPLIPLLSRFTAVPHCFPAQSCYGHFVHRMEPYLKNTARLEAYEGRITRVEYRLAYLTIVVRDDSAGQDLLRDLRAIPAISPAYIQFGCAEWFWARQVNSYVVQVEPVWGCTKDRLFVDFPTALLLEKVRDRFFDRLEEIARVHAGTGECRRDPGTLP